MGWWTDLNRRERREQRLRIREIVALINMTLWSDGDAEDKEPGQLARVRGAGRNGLEIVARMGMTFGAVFKPHSSNHRSKR
jgi:hypothetical protein